MAGFNPGDINFTSGASGSDEDPAQTAAMRFSLEGNPPRTILAASTDIYRNYNCDVSEVPPQAPDFDLQATQGRLTLTRASGESLVLDNLMYARAKWDHCNNRWIMQVLDRGRQGSRYHLDSNNRVIEGPFPDNTIRFNVTHTPIRKR